jgi:hypothetical protein
MHEGIYFAWDREQPDSAQWEDAPPRMQRWHQVQVLRSRCKISVWFTGGAGRTRGGKWLIRGPQQASYHLAWLELPTVLVEGSSGVPGLLYSWVK